MTFLLNLIGFFIIFGMVTTVFVSVFIIEYVKRRLFRKNKNIYKYIRRR